MKTSSWHTCGNRVLGGWFRWFTSPASLFVAPSFKSPDSSPRIRTPASGLSSLIKKRPLRRCDVPAFTSNSLWALSRNPSNSLWALYLFQKNIIAHGGLASVNTSKTQSLRVKQLCLSTTARRKKPRPCLSLAQGGLPPTPPTTNIHDQHINQHP